MSQTIEEDADAYRLDAQLMSDLWIFRAAARHESITAAARRLGVTQGAVSQRVLRLEARLATPLFVRNKSRITLTEAGISLMGAMSDVAMILNDAVSRIHHQQRGAIVVSCFPSLATEWLVPHLEDFYSENPGIEIFVRSELFPSTVERMEDEGIDISIDYSPHPIAELQELASLQEFIFPVCSRDYLDRLGADAELPIVLLHDDVPWIGGASGDEWNAWRRGAATRWPESPASERHFNLAHLAYHAALCSQGIAIGRSVVVNRLIERGELVAALDRPPVPGPTFRLLTHRPGDAQSPQRRFALWWEKSMQRTQRATLDLIAARR